MLHPKHEQWLINRGIDPELAVRFGMSTVQDESGNWLRLPFFENGVEVNYKDRKTAEKQFRQKTSGKQTLWNIDVLREDSVQSGGQLVVITEGEIDGLLAISAGHPHTVSVPAGAPEKSIGPLEESQDNKFRWFWDNRHLLENVSGFILAVDNDGPGRVLAQELVIRLGIDRCYHVEYPEGCKDLGDVAQKHSLLEVARILNSAKPWPVKGLYSFSDFPDPPPVQVMSSGWAVCDEYFSIVPGTFTVLTGIPNMGKSTWLLAMIGNLVREQRINVCLASFETMTKPILHRAMCSAVERSSFGAPKRPETIQLVDERVKIIAQAPQDDDTSFAISDIIELAEIAVVRHGVRLLVIDPWNEIEHKRDRDESETDYTGRAIREIKRFAKNYHCAVWIVAHPAKPMDGSTSKLPTLYNISGSANWYNKADYGLCYHRQKGSDFGEIHIQKVRMGLPGRRGYLLTQMNGGMFHVTKPDGVAP